MDDSENRHYFPFDTNDSFHRVDINVSLTLLTPLPFPPPEFGFKPQTVSRQPSNETDQSSPKRAPDASTARRAAAAAASQNFDITENARVALEEKQKLVDKLTKRLALTEHALSERETQTRALTKKLSERDGKLVLDDAEALGASLRSAMRDVSGFFSLGGKLKTAGNGTDDNIDDSNENGTNHRLDPNGTSNHSPKGTPPPSALKSSGLKKTHTPNGVARGVSFVSRSEQERLDEEGGFVMRLTMKTRENETLLAKLLVSEEQLERKRNQMRVAKSNYQALQTQLIDAEAALALKSKPGRGSSGGQASASDSINNSRDSSINKTTQVLQDLLRITTHCAGVSGRVCTRGVLQALPLLAQLAKQNNGQVSIDLIEANVLELVSETFSVHAGDSRVCARLCALLAQLCAGANAASADDLLQRKRRCASKVFADFKQIARRALQTLADHAKDPTACACAMDLIHELTELALRSGEVVGYLLTQNVLTSVVASTEWHARDEDVLVAAAIAIGTLVKHGGRNELGLIARTPGAVSTVSNAVALGVVGISRFGPDVMRWVEENETRVFSERNDRYRSREETDGGFNSPNYANASETVTPRRRAAIPENDQYVGSGLKPNRPPGGGIPLTPQVDKNIDSDDDFDDDQFDDNL